MKSIKMIGLAALAALMTMAFVGASSAMAENTQLCKADEGTCSAGNIITHVHEETLTGNKAKLLSSLGTVECKALFLGDTLGSGKPLIIHGKFTYTECKRGAENCTAEEKSADSLIEVLKEGHETAKVTGEGEINVRCGFFINCTYNGENLKGTAKGPLLSSFANGDVSLSEQTTEKVSGLCPETGKLDISMMPLEATYIASGNGGGGGGGGGIAVLVQTLMTVGVTYTVTIDNTGGSTVFIESETWDGKYLEGLGSSCLGNLGPGASCSNRELKCVRKGETTYTVNASSGSVPVKIKCD